MAEGVADWRTRRRGGVREPEDREFSFFSFSFLGGDLVQGLLKLGKGNGLLTVCALGLPAMVVAMVTAPLGLLFFGGGVGAGVHWYVYFDVPLVVDTIIVEGMRSVRLAVRIGG